jgi:hypothetical protein
MNRLRKDIKKAMTFTVVKNNKIFRNKFIKRSERPLNGNYKSLKKEIKEDIRR